MSRYAPPVTRTQARKKRAQPPAAAASPAASRLKAIGSKSTTTSDTKKDEGKGKVKRARSPSPFEPTGSEGSDDESRSRRGAAVKRPTPARPETRPVKKVEAKAEEDDDTKEAAGSGSMGLGGERHHSDPFAQFFGPLAASSFSSSSSSSAPDPFAQFFGPLAASSFSSSSSSSAPAHKDKSKSMGTRWPVLGTSILGISTKAKELAAAVEHHPWDDHVYHFSPAKSKPRAKSKAISASTSDTAEQVAAGGHALHSLCFLLGKRHKWTPTDKDIFVLGCTEKTRDKSGTGEDIIYTPHKTTEELLLDFDLPVCRVATNRAGEWWASGHALVAILTGGYVLPAYFETRAKWDAMVQSPSFKKAEEDKGLTTFLSRDKEANNYLFGRIRNRISKYVARGFVPQYIATTRVVAWMLNRLSGTRFSSDIEDEEEDDDQKDGEESGSDTEGSGDDKDDEEKDEEGKQEEEEEADGKESKRVTPTPKKAATPKKPALFGPSMMEESQWKLFRNAARDLMSGRNVILSGIAGAGRSTLLNEFIRRKGGADAVPILTGPEVSLVDLRAAWTTKGKSFSTFILEAGNDLHKCLEWVEWLRLERPREQWVINTGTPDTLLPPLSLKSVTYRFVYAMTSLSDARAKVDEAFLWAATNTEDAGEGESEPFRVTGDELKARMEAAAGDLVAGKNVILTGSGNARLCLNAAFIREGRGKVLGLEQEWLEDEDRSSLVDAMDEAGTTTLDIMTYSLQEANAWVDLLIQEKPTFPWVLNVMVPGPLGIWRPDLPPAAEHAFGAGPLLGSKGMQPWKECETLAEASLVRARLRRLTGSTADPEDKTESKTEAKPKLKRAPRTTASGKPKAKSKGKSSARARGSTAASAAPSLPLASSLPYLSLITRVAKGGKCLHGPLAGDDCYVERVGVAEKDVQDVLAAAAKSRDVRARLAHAMRHGWSVDDCTKVKVVIPPPEWRERLHRMEMVATAPSMCVYSVPDFFWRNDAICPHSI
jgi:hypothetical protein